jgi:hypothetical protein
MDWRFMAPIIEVDLEQEEIVLGSVAQAEEAASSKLSFYETLPLTDLDDEAIRTIATSADFSTLCARSNQVGVMVRGFRVYFEKYKPIVAAMKERMCAPRGSHKKTKINEREYTWASYCEEVYGVSYQWVQRLLNGDYLPVKNEDAVEEVKSAHDEAVDTEVPQTVEKKPSKKDAIIADLKKRNDNLHQQVEELAFKLRHINDDKPQPNVDASMADAILASAMAKHEAKVETEADLDDDGFGFVTDYFEPLIQPLSFASELDRIIRHCNMQAHIKTVLVEESPAATEGL